MKKLIAAVLLAAAFMLPVFSYDGNNQQKIYSVDSGVYKSMETLYILSGQSLPSSSGPWSEAELQLMLERIDISALSDAGKSQYDSVKAMITSEPRTRYKDNLAMQFGLTAALEGYAHNNPKFDDYNDWFHSFTDRNPLFKGTFETWATDNFYGYFEISLGNNIGYDVGRPEGNHLYKQRYNINIPILNAILLSKPSNGNILADFDWTVPYRAFAAAGGQHWSVMAGRDKLSWGNGETGNLMLSDSFPRHTLLRFNTFFDKFKYSLLGTIYPSRDAKESQYDSLDGYKAMVVHRLEFWLFNNKVSLTLNEACMFWSTPEQKFSLAQINPFGFMHNEYIAGNGNSLLVFEANCTPFAGINIYGQAAVDEFSGPGEGRVNPAAFGIMAGIKGATAVGSGIFTGSLEFVKTDPFLYIRGLHYKDDEKSLTGYGYDAYFRTISCDRIILERMSTTYKYGNDVILFDGKINYEIPKVFSVGFEAMFMKHGVMDIGSKWHMYNGAFENAPNISTPSTANPFDSTETGEVESSTILSLTGEYYIVKGLSISAKADFLFVKNLDNILNNNQTDIQVTGGIKYEL
ncbi:MAG: hypothetical protein ACTTJW_02170 [Sphaerochaeta sp.]